MHKAFCVIIVPVKDSSKPTMQKLNKEDLIRDLIYSLDFYDGKRVYE